LERVVAAGCVLNPGTLFRGACIWGTCSRALQMSTVWRSGPFIKGTFETLASSGCLQEWGHTQVGTWMQARPLLTFNFTGLGLRGPCKSLVAPFPTSGPLCLITSSWFSENKHQWGLYKTDSIVYWKEFELWREAAPNLKLDSFFL
jgi:hypothetical protein